MAAKAPSVQYDPVAKALHWLIAIAIVAMLAIGWIMTSMDNSSAKFTLFQLHKSIGITILLLALFRLGWRFTHRPPPLPDTMAGWEKVAANGTHVLLYALMIGMPLLGWVIVSASPLNLPTLLYGVVPWPHLPLIPEMENKREIGHLAGAAHYYLAWVLLALFLGHAGAAWKHHLFNRDDVLTRMAPKFMHGILNRIRGQK